MKINKSDNDIITLRNKINELDRKSLEIIKERLEVSNMVGLSKLKTKSPVTDFAREKIVISEAQKQFDPSMNHRIESIMSTIMRISRERQYEILYENETNWQIGQKLKSALKEIESPSKIACQGTKGSYSHLVASRIYPDAILFPTQTFHEAFSSVCDGLCDMAMVPLENTTAGTVNDVVDLLTENDLSIIKSFSVPISHKLLMLPNSDLSLIKTVISHPQALAQCSKFIQKMGWNQESAENTAFAAMEVIGRNDTSACAIGSREAALHNNLKIDNSQICDSIHNQTRFVAVSKSFIIEPCADKISLEFSLPHQSGSLASVLCLLAERGLNLTKIQSRPVPDKPWEYSFWVDITANPENKEVELALYQLSAELPFIKLIGWYSEEIVET